MKRANKVIASVLSVLSLAICCDCTTSNENNKRVDRRTYTTYTYNGQEFRTHTIQYNGAAYMKMPLMTEISQFIISCPFDEYKGDDGHSYHIYTSSKDTEKNFLCSAYGLAGKENPPKDFSTGYVKVGYQFPNIYEVELSSASVIIEEVNVTQVKSVEEVVATFETPMLLTDIIDAENPIMDFDESTNAYAIFDIKDNVCLRLGEFAVCIKEDVLYLRLHAWEEKYYKIKDAYQSLYKAALENA